MSISARPELAQLRELLGIVKNPNGYRPRHRFSPLGESGLPQGGLIEISGTAGSGKSELVLRFLAENPEIRAAWIEEELTVYPCAFPQHGVRLDRVLFSEAGAHALWATQQIIRSQLFQAVILSAAQLRETGPVYPLFNSEMNLRRLQLTAERTGTTVLLLNETPTTRGAWPITLQLQLEGHELRVVRGQSIPRGVITTWNRRT